jgi:hypothetical protein
LWSAWRNSPGAVHKRKQLPTTLACLMRFLQPTQGHNLKGSAKAWLLSEKLGRFSYLGNSNSDMPVWNGAETVGIANASKNLARRVAAELDANPPPQRGGKR